MLPSDHRLPSATEFSSLWLADLSQASGRDLSQTGCSLHYDILTRRATEGAARNGAAGPALRRWYALLRQPHIAAQARVELRAGSASLGHSMGLERHRQ